MNQYQNIKISQNTINVGLSYMLSTFIVLIFLILLEGSAQAAITTGNAETATNTSGSQPNTITYVGVGGRRELSACGNLTPPIPAGTVNDLLIASIAARNTGTNIATPTGWIRFGESTYVGQDLKSFLYYRIATGADAVTFTTTGACSSTGVRVARFNNVDTADPLEPLPIPYATGDTNVTQSNSDDITTGTITTTEATDMVLISTYINNRRRVDEADGFSQSFDDRRNVAQDYGHGLFYRLETTTGNKSVTGWDLSGPGNDENIDYIYALKPSTTVGDPDSLSIAVPAGTTTGDVMIATIAITSTTTVTADADWILQNRIDHTDTRSAQMVYSRVVDGTEAASYTWTFGVPVTDAVGGIITYSGVDTVSPFDVNPSDNETSSSVSHTASEVTTIVNNAMVISVHSYTSSENWTPPTAMSEQVDIASRTPSDSAGISLEMNDVLQATAGLTGDKTATAGGNADTGITHLFALTPYIPTAPAVEYHMDESTWGTVVDTSGNGVDGSVVGTGVVPAPYPATTPNPALTSDPGTCGYGDFPDNTDDTIAAIDSTFTPGNVGSISFWFNNKNDWDSSGDRLLFDASNDLGNGGADKHFFLIRRNNNNGSLRFELEDSADTLMSADTGNLGILADEWAHIAVTWDLPNDQLQIYVNGALEDTDNTPTSGTIGNIQSVYIGDQRDTGTNGNGFSNDSANGYIDEFKIYNSVISYAQVVYDASVRHACTTPTLQNFVITVSATASTCLPTEITIEARDTTNAIFDCTGTINLTTSTSNGDWGDVDDGSSESGTNPATNTVTNGTADDGAATYLFDILDTGRVGLFLYDEHAETLTVTVEDLTVAGSSTTSTNIVFSDNVFEITPTTCTGTTCPGTGSYEVVAGRNHIFKVDMVRNDGTSCGVAAGYNNAAQTLKGWIVRHADDPNGTLPTLTEATAALGNNAAPGVDNVTLDFSGGGTTTLTLETTDVGKFELFLRDTTSGFADVDIDGSTGAANQITVRPFGFGFANITGLVANPEVSTPGGTRFATAGSSYSADVGGYRYDSADDVDSDGVPDTNHDVADNGNTTTPSYAWDTRM